MLCNIFCHAQESRSVISVGFRVNSTRIDPSIFNNAQNIDKIVSLLKYIQNDTTIHITNVYFCGSASPEGSYQVNRRLAAGRMRALEREVRSRVDIPESIITRDSSYIPWQYLHEMVKQSDLQDKERVMEIINQEPKLVDYYGNRNIDHRIIQLKALSGGRTWRKLFQRYFREMRNSCVIFVTYTSKVPVFIPHEADLSPHMAPYTAIDIPAPTYKLPQPWVPQLHLKTNFIGWGFAISNIGVEADLCRHWSVTLPVYYSAWNYFRSTVKFRTFAVQPEVRYWLNDNNNGFFAGAHLGLAYYNIATNGDYRTQDHNGTSPALGGGLAVGYRKPISKDKHWKLEMTVGAGVYALHHDKFHNYNNGLLTTTERKTYFGIDQAAISLVYSLDMKKGGTKR